MMLPMAVPLFVVPRIVARHLTHRLSGRALLCLGLGLVGGGLFWVGLVATDFAYASVLGGMLVAGVGAGILNGEVATVGMTVIPPERAGMAAGVGGAVRFAGLVVGFAALGAILFGRVTSTLSALLPGLSGAERGAIAQPVVAGDLPRAVAIKDGLDAIAMVSFGAGYQAMFFAAASLAAVAALASWLLVRSTDTARVPRHLRSNDLMALPVE
jgi:hypothetical protein